MKPDMIIKVGISPEARAALVASLKWIRRIEERSDDLPVSFLDGIDPMPLRKRIESILGRDEKGRE